MLQRSWRAECLMASEPPFIALTADAARMIRGSERTRGSLALRLSKADQIYVVEQVETHADQFVGVRIPRDFEALNWGDSRFSAQWFRTSDEALAYHYIYMLRRPGAAISFDNFRKMLIGVEDPGG